MHDCQKEVQLSTWGDLPVHLYPYRTILSEGVPFLLRKSKVQPSRGRRKDLEKRSLRIQAGLAPVKTVQPRLHRYRFRNDRETRYWFPEQVYDLPIRPIRLHPSPLVSKEQFLQNDVESVEIPPPHKPSRLFQTNSSLHCHEAMQRLDGQTAPISPRDPWNQEFVRLILHPDIGWKATRIFGAILWIHIWTERFDSEDSLTIRHF